ncbi:putative ABC transport system ATP-binding protein [Clostridium sp. DSM 8431]|uniref:ABC transporter ATP-binding protein n=1 Tax=Clostridium sp. DSM 8431 TaxID=1761781 RepID=UPI0008EBABFB|nr:putative ABC transport system ATP-binding protein [Clostridium sp. DSM 8431]
MDTKIIIQAKDICKLYGEGEARTQILDKASAEFEEGKIHTIYGASGSGKSTFLNIIGGLDKADEGQVFYEKKDIMKLSNKDLVNFRKKYMGYVFQMYNLIPNLTVKENIEVCEYLSDNPLDIEELIHVLGLEAQKNRFPSQLSGGQQQRCAIGRALVKNPMILLCDEPTGALDYNTSRNILVLLEEINQKYGTTMIIVTHNNSIKEMSHYNITIKDGHVIKNEKNLNLKKASDLEW